MTTPTPPRNDSAKWAAVDNYFSKHLAPEDEALHNARKAHPQISIPDHDVSTLQGKFLGMLVTMTQAKRVLEIGTLRGYSTIWLARAVGETGRVTTIEIDPDRAHIARQNYEAAGCSAHVDIQVGDATTILPTLEGPFDFIFIDADKPNNPTYLDWGIRLARVGTVIVVDNVVRDGAVIDADSPAPSVIGVQQMTEIMANHERLDSTAIQTVGTKGWDGFTVSIVKA